MGNVTELQESGASVLGVVATGNSVPEVTGQRAPLTKGERLTGSRRQQHANYQR